MGAFPWGQVGPSAVLAFAVFLILTGRLVPRSHLNDSQRRETEWRDLALESQKQAGELINLNRELSVAGQANKALIEAITEVANENRNRANSIEAKDIRT